MKPLGFQELQQLPAVQFYQTAFRKATGVSLKVVPPLPQNPPSPCGVAENPFCRLMHGSPAGCAACMAAEARIQVQAARRESKQQTHCYAGLTTVAAPVFAGGQHMATLIAGQIFRREPTERDFSMIMAQFSRAATTDWIKKAHAAYFETPVVTAERFQAAVQLLEVFAQNLAESAGRQAMAASPCEPRPVASAKEFVQAHAEESIGLDEVLEHVHVSRFYFCKLFKRATGMTLTEYIARVRVEKAKALLMDSSHRISEVVFASGFGSIPQFNSVFKRHVGMPPSAYRASLRGTLPA